MARVKKFDNIEAIYADIVENAKRAAIIAVKETGKQLYRDMHNEAMRALAYYYDEKVFKPEVYERTGNLKNVLSGDNRIFEFKQSGNKATLTVGLRYHSSNMEPYDPYVDANWVIANFVEGIHPVRNKPVYEPESRTTTDILEHFMRTKVPVLAKRYMQNALINEFTKRMKAVKKNG